MLSGTRREGAESRSVGREVRSQDVRPVQIDGRECSRHRAAVNEDEHANAAGQVVICRHLGEAEHRHVIPSRVPSGFGRLDGPQVGCGGEDCQPHGGRTTLVAALEFFEERPHSVGDCFGRIRAAACRQPHRHTERIRRRQWYEHSHSLAMIETGDTRLHLIAITDDLRDGMEGLVQRALAAERGGVTMVLLRLKHADARTVVEVGRALVTSLRIPVIVSERLDVALACGAAGVHLTSRSVPVVAIRPHVSAGFLIGGSISAAEDLEPASHADYVTIGPVFGDPSASIGVDAFRRFVLASDRPAIAIGGIEASNAAAVRAAGASGVAVIRAVLGADDPAQAAAALILAMDPLGASRRDQANRHADEQRLG